LRFTALRHPANVGLPSTRNTAIKRSTGEWIAFLDADDVWLPDKIASQIELLRQDDRTNLLYTNYWIWDGENDLGLRYSGPHKMPDGAAARRLYYWNPFGISSVMVKREALDAVGNFDPKLLAVEDWDLWLRIAETGLRARGVPTPQLRYRVWAGSMMKNTARMTDYIVRVLEKALTRPQPPERLRHYLRSLQIARGNFEFAKARAMITAQPQYLPAAAWRAWRHCPRRLKWLLWYLALVWPRSLGGGWSSRMVHRKICSKW
jgi:glycosyltransferase involved in cell wall biosynthesis